MVKREGIGMDMIDSSAVAQEARLRVDDHCRRSAQVDAVLGQIWQVVEDGFLHVAATAPP